MAAADCLFGSSDWRSAGFLDFLAQEEVQSRAQNDDCRELPDFVPAGRNRRAQNIGRELEFERQREPAAQFEPNTLLIDRMRREPAGRIRVSADEDPDRSNDRLRDRRGDDQSGGRLDGIGEIKGQLLEEGSISLPSLDCR